MGLFDKPETNFVNDIKHYKGQCATCSNYYDGGLSKGYTDGFHCKIRYKRLSPDDSCSKYTKDSNITIKDIKKAYEEITRKYGKIKSKEDNKYGSWFHVTTKVCEILGINEHLYYLKIGQWFREEVLEKNLKYVNLLVKYDIYGRMIANSIQQDEQKENVAHQLLTEYIIPFTGYIENEEYELAIGLYTQMVEILMETYKITDVINYDQNNTYQTNEADILKLVRKK